jgi:hypothetical protein
LTAGRAFATHLPCKGMIPACADVFVTVFESEHAHGRPEKRLPVSMFSSPSFRQTSHHPLKELRFLMSSRPFRGVFLSCGGPSGSCGAALLSVNEHLYPSVMRTGFLKAPVLPSIFSFRHFSACLSYDITQRMEHGGRGYDLDHPHVHRLCCDRIPVLGSGGSCALWQGRGPLPHPWCANLSL